MAQVNTRRIYDEKSELTLDRKYKTTYSAESPVKKAPALPEARKVSPVKHASAAIINATKQTTGEIIAKHRRPMHGQKIETKSIEVKNKTFPATLIIAALICTSMLTLMIFNYAKEYELAVTISRQESSLEKLNTKLAELEDQTETALDSADIVRFAKDELGYVPKDQLSARVISTEHHDTIRSLRAEEKKNGGIGTLLSSLYGMFKNIFE